MVIMTQENKEFLLKDLCTWLPYGVIGKYSWKRREPYNRELTGNLYDELKSSWNSTGDSEFFPYLRSMSSMSKEELKNLCDAKEITSNSICYHAGGTMVDYLLVSYSFCSEIIDWLNAHYFDYRGLIPKGLAIEVTEDNNPYKE